MKYARKIWKKNKFRKVLCIWYKIFTVIHISEVWNVIFYRNLLVSQAAVKYKDTVIKVCYISVFLPGERLESYWHYVWELKSKNEKIFWEWKLFIGMCNHLPRYPLEYSAIFIWIASLTWLEYDYYGILYFHVK